MVGVALRVEILDIAGKREVQLGPVADARQVGSERVRDNVVWVADEQRTIAHVWEAFDLLEHFGVIVGSESSVFGLHREPADEVGQPDVGRRLKLGVLAQVVVDVPAFVGQPQVVMRFSDRVVEDQEVGEQNLVQIEQAQVPRPVSPVRSIWHTLREPGLTWSRFAAYWTANLETEPTDPVARRRCR
jgi:hypothetical protein